ncbi:MAG: nucleoside phosphorylase, partial [Flavobacteriales bacterium]
MLSTLQPPGRIPESELVLRNDVSLYHLGVRREHIADKVIIVGDPDRVSKISQRFEYLEVKISSREFVIHTGQYQGKRITVVSSGIGVDNIDIVINELDAAVNVDLKTREIRLPGDRTSLQILRLGTCGSLHSDIPVGTHICSRYAFAVDGVPWSYEAQSTEDECALTQELQNHFEWLNHPSLYSAAAGESLFQQLSEGCISGITATANGFYGPQGRSVRLKSRMNQRINDYTSFEWKGYRITNFEMECAGIYALSSMLGHQALTLCVALA